jgi:hypothetical protein
MELISKADVVLALGTRLNPFSTLPGYGIDYWPKDAKIIQVDINPDRIGLTKTGHRRHRRRCRQGGERHPGQLAHGRRRGPRRARSADHRRPSPLGAELAAWITKTTIPAPPGTSAPATASPTG